jgi:hypothetical protein
VLTDADFVGEYSVVSAHDAFGTNSLLHFGNIVLKTRENATLKLKETVSGSEHEIHYAGADVTGLIVSLKPGKYEVAIQTRSGVNAKLCAQGKAAFDVKAGGETFFDKAEICGSGQLSVGAKAGIAVAGVVATVVVIGAIAFLLKRGGVDLLSRCRKNDRGVVLDDAASAPSTYTVDL